MRHLLTIFTSITMVSGVPDLAAQIQRPEGSGVIEGTVTNSVTGVGIPDVAVFVQIVNEQVSLEILAGRTAAGFIRTTTDSAGNFRIAGLPAGKYYLQVTAENYLRGGPVQPPPPYTISANQTIRIRAELMPFSTISGRVVDENANPFAGAKVKLENDVGRELDEKSQTLTKEDGSYSFPQVPPLTYRIIAIPPDEDDVANAVADDTETPPVQQDSVQQSPVQQSPVQQNSEYREFAPTYYPSGLDPGGATRIVVSEGAKLTGYDIKLQATPVYRLSGRVQEVDGTLNGIATVQLYPLHRNTDTELSRMWYLTRPTRPGEMEQDVQTDADGNFVFNAVRPGDWYVVAHTQLEADPEDYEVWLRAQHIGIIETRVDRGDVDRLEITSQSSVRLEIQATGAPPNWKPRVQTISMAPDEIEGIEITVPSEDPAIWLQLGSHYILPIAPQGYYASSILLNGSPIQQPVQITGPSKIEIRYVPATGTVRGTVKGDAQLVFLAPQQLAGPAKLTTAQVGTNGAFEIPGVAPGNYYAVAGNGIGVLDPSTIASQGTLVRVLESSVSTVELTAIPGY